MKALRLDALRDPVAHLAFLEAYDDAVAEPDEFWQGRASRASHEDGPVRQFVAETGDGVWVGTATVLIEEAGTTDWAGYPVERRQGHVVGVFVQPAYRGTGVTEAVFETALEWAWGRGAERVRLLVHEENTRAQGFYRKAGFRPTGVTVPVPHSPERSELEYVIEKG